MDRRLALIAVLIATLSKCIGAEKTIVCYYRNWVRYSKSPLQLTPEGIDANLCTVINVAFMGVHIDNHTITTSGVNDEDTFVRLNALKIKNPDLKVVISVGE